MSIDPARLARIRARLLAAAAVTAAGCGPTYINDRKPDPPTETPAGPSINTPAPEHINTPPPAHVNTPPEPQTADTTARSPAELAPPGQTINTAQIPPTKAPGPPHTINIVKVPDEKPHHVNTPKPNP